MAFVAARIEIALLRSSAIRALSRRNAGRLSWKRTAFKFMESEEENFFFLVDWTGMMMMMVQSRLSVLISGDSSGTSDHRVDARVSSGPF